MAEIKAQLFTLEPDLGTPSAELSFQKLNGLSQLTGQIAFGNATDTYLSFRSVVGGAITERLRIHTNGNVGIGTASPSSLLHVAGTVTATAFQGNGAGLTNVSGTDSTKVAKTGDTMTGPLTVNGFARSLGLSVNDASNTGVGRGLWLWAATDPNHVIYSAHPSGKSPANNNAVAGYFDSNHRLRLRTATGQGFLFENNAESALVDIDSDDGRLWTKGAVHAGNSDLYFTKTDHNHTGFGNTPGYAAIENAANYGALMILGRSTPQGRIVKLWDFLEVNGNIGYTGQMSRLAVANEFTAEICCADLKMGHSSRKGRTGRALVDYTNTLHVNYGPDWPNLRLNGVISYGSSKEIKDNIIDLTAQKALDILLAMKPVEFNFRCDEEKSRQVGFIAEDVPEGIGTKDKKAITPFNILGVLTKIVQEHHQAIMALSAPSKAH